MKKCYFFALLGLLIIQSAFKAPGQLPDPQYPNYVVIGAFEFKKNAIKFTNQASKEFSVKYEINPSRNLYYVYILKTNDKKQAIEEALRLQSSSPYADTWVYSGPLGADVMASTSGKDINPVTRRNIETIPVADTPANQSLTSLITPQSEAGEVMELEKVPAREKEIISEQKISATPEQTASAVTDDKARNFYFKLFRADNNESISGDVSVIDAERVKKLGTYSGNKDVRVSSPGNTSGNVSLICEVFGYRKVQRDINFNNPEGEGIALANSSVVVPFDLVRLQKGDIAVMYNVYFFKDAAIMRPESRWEVSSLLDMLNENPKYKIKIHGHTNGNAAGKIISKGEKSDNFFSLSDTKEGFGSAKKLSQERAEIIRDFLLANGIDAKRMHVKAWGGKKPVVDKMHTQAQNNVRVEIEILEH
ncbi:MAG: OmpA family protein [Cyclobacteriaceae bacterium]|nr:OmpA family protein [Cyclobacteriaceae bacterium]UYN86346.1 MAG: OmpA family protein [Cyclobacteriaceae bacterium]